MPPRNERVATMVQRELARNPNLDNAALREKAIAFDRSVKRLSPRQFHATYRLPALRGMKSSGRAAGAANTKPQTRSAPARSAPAQQSQAAAAPAPAAQSESAQSAPAQASAAHPTSHSTPHSTPSSSSRSTALARPNAAEREAVRQILGLVAREALASEDRASFIRLLDSLDERAAVILGIFGRA